MYPSGTAKDSFRRSPFCPSSGVQGLGEALFLFQTPHTPTHTRTFLGGLLLVKIFFLILLRLLPSRVFEVVRLRRGSLAWQSPTLASIFTNTHIVNSVCVCLCKEE